MDYSGTKLVLTDNSNIEGREMEELCSFDEEELFLRRGQVESSSQEQTGMVPIGHKAVASKEDIGSNQGKITDYEKVWWEKLEAVQKYRELHGTFDLPSTSTLYKWLANQQQLCNNPTKRSGGYLTPDREAALKEMGLIGIWKKRKKNGGKSYEKWKIRVEQVQKFHEEFGHFQITASQDKQLFTWISNVKKAFRKHLGRQVYVPGKSNILFLDEERLQDLADIGLAAHWKEEMERKAADAKWFRNVGRLKKLHWKDGHVKQAGMTIELVRWIYRQKYEYQKLKGTQKSTMTPGRLEAVATLGITKLWDEEMKEKQNLAT